MNKKEIPLNEKYVLSINEAAAYFGIGIKKMRRLAECSLRSSAVSVPFLSGRFPTQNGRSFFNQVT